MSNDVYPALPGLTWDVTRTPTWSTTVKTAVSLREYRAANASFPVYHYKLAYSLLRQKAAFAELATLAGFYNKHQGAFDSFLFNDPDDNAASNQVIGVGDGVATNFQMVRTFGGFVEPVFDLISGTFSIYLNGVLQTSGVGISSTGLVVFSTAPGAGVVVSWYGLFYRRCRFLTDSVEFNKFMAGMWEVQAGGLELISVKP